ncbi:MAG: 50S ribosomal protein L10 [Candidatus Kapabacteria bacterium]|nr:50S ribosomal protein L10 [Ignavibacteriota bacterium]MCW5885463.1 50S ribosomal protein L10 [Candidatus Kapabacteria bacterium]
MITRERKQHIVDGLVELLDNATGVYLVDFTSMTVAESYKFRKVINEKKLVYRVAKNTLIDRAVEKVGKYSVPAENLIGQTGLVISYDDPTEPAKVIKEFFEKGDKPKLKGAFVEGQYYPGSELKTIAALPSRADLVAGILGSLNSPASGIVGAINAVMRDVASLVEEVAKKQNNAA